MHIPPSAPIARSHLLSYRTHHIHSHTQIHIHTPHVLVHTYSLTHTFTLIPRIYSLFTHNLSHTFTDTHTPTLTHTHSLPNCGCSNRVMRPGWDEASPGQRGQATCDFCHGNGSMARQVPDLPQIYKHTPWEVAWCCGRSIELAVRRETWVLVLTLLMTA